MNEVAIVGVGIHPFGRTDGVSGREQGAAAARAALGDAGISWADVQVAFGGSYAAGNADALVADLGWSDDVDGAHARALADGLAQLEAAGLPLGEERLRGYAAAALDIGRAELAGMPREDRPGAVAYAVIGTLLAEPVILALRRMAHEHLSSSAGEGR